MVPNPNLVLGQLVLVGDAEDLAHKGAYRLGRVHYFHSQLRQGKEIVRSATIAVLVRNAAAGADKNRVGLHLAYLSKIAPV